MKEIIDTTLFLGELSDFFNGKDESLSKYAGAPFITSDNKIWDFAKNDLTAVSPTNVPAKRSRHIARLEQKSGLASTLKGERCEYAVEGAAPMGNDVKEFVIGSGRFWTFDSVLLFFEE
ncbi:hypothetical protein CORC01_12765 [Colletotrichum orchidophilum]|uniref:Uncharacterized protein n=1 Tax=Colletotrichum orchidophilum TaxID=1209926 RepID=A0A1G4AS25_9PEZI|nr:uncharacterized protein CORC01_12765 [Colletotrichum orchidophilum]OHE91915.1 hypothetical protein CORC01_12765 [Colletotrichum orchidophilum]